MDGPGVKRTRMDESDLSQDSGLAAPTNNYGVEIREPSTAEMRDVPRTQILKPVTQSSFAHLSSLPGGAQQPSRSAMPNDEPTTLETPEATATENSYSRGASVREMGSTLPSRGQGARARGVGVRGCKGRRQSLAFASREDEDGLYSTLTGNAASLTDVVNRWIELYKTDRDTAVLTLTQFFFSSSGCKCRLTPEMQETMEYDAIIRTMTEEYNEESAVYPLIAGGKRWTKFRINFGRFVETVVRQCRYSIIYDRYLMDKLISLLTGLSDSQVRAFRHTATYATMKLMTALASVASTVTVDLRKTRRQYDAEGRKSRENRATERLESLASIIGELEENVMEIKEMLEYMFKSVFVHRYTDVVPDIRSTCIAEIGLWMIKFDEYFLDDSYLKYVGWHLHDKVGDVRLKSLEALRPLYASKNFAARLDFFTRKFKDRIVDMTLDKEHDVAVQAVRLVTSILKNHRDAVTDENCEEIYELVYSTHREVARAAGEFLNERLFRADDEAVVVAKTKRGKQRLPDTAMIRDLVVFFIEAEVHEHAAYLVDSLIESNRMMKNWECMTDLLLEEAGPDEETLNDQHESCLIEIMVCCVKQAATGEAPIGRGPARKIVSAKKLSQVQDDKRKLTEHFIPTLPLLLKKYRADPEKIANLVAVPQYFELGMYTTMRQEPDLDYLLETMHAIAEKSHDADVLKTAAKTLECLCADGQGISQPCEVARSILLDRIVDKYRQARDRYATVIDNGETPDDDETFDVVDSLKKISVYYSSHDMNSYEIWESLHKNLEEARFPSGRLPEEALVYCARACYFSILWSHNSFLEAEVSDVGATIETHRLDERLRSFVETMMFLLGDDVDQSDLSSLATLREEAYVSICDCMIFFNEPATKDSNSARGRLTLRPDDRARTALNRFVQENVFLNEPDGGLDVERKIERLHKLRNFLAGYCKIVVHTTVPSSAAADVFKHYVKYYNDYGDIIKSTIGKAREKDRTHCARTMQISLRRLYDEMIEARGEVNRTSEEFVTIKELAKRFALSFGFDIVKNSEAVLALHGDGVSFAVASPDGAEHDSTSPPANLPFLEVLAEFSCKLVDKDKRTVLNFIDTEFQAGLLTLRGDEWKPLLIYRNSLMHGAADQGSVGSKRVYARREKDRAAGVPLRIYSKNQWNSSRSSEVYVGDVIPHLTHVW